MFRKIISVLLLISSPMGSAADKFRYTVTVDKELSELVIQITSEATEKKLYASGSFARVLTHDPHYCNSKEPVQFSSGAMQVNSVDESLCIRYRFLLERLPRLDWNNKVNINAAKNRVAAPAHWLWLPEVKDNEVYVQFTLPDGFHVSVPWDKTSKETYRIRSENQSSSAVVVFGEFYKTELTIPGSRLRLAVLQGNGRQVNDKITHWIKTRAMDLVIPYGRFPHRSPQIIVVPVKPRLTGNGSAIPFGHVIRDGGEAVQFFVDPLKPLQEYLGDWTATHEFSHLMLPYIRSSQKWISEGFASYYQNVLLARAGVYTPETAWRKLYRGFSSAEREAGHMSPNSTINYEFWDARMMIYWSGAAIALLADVTLRDRTDNQESLDTVLDKLERCCLPSDRTWTGMELFVKLDELSITPVFVDLYKKYADKTGMPDYRRLYEQLGITISGDSFSTDDSALYAWIRADIMALAGQDIPGNRSPSFRRNPYRN